MRKFLFTGLMLFSTWCLALTTSQIQALHNFVNSDSTAQACVSTGNDGCLFEYLNSLSTFIVWRTRIQDAEIYAATGFDFTLVDGLSAGKRDEWKDFIFRSGYCDPSQPNIRAGFADVWSGTAAKNAVQALILTLAKRPAKIAEKVLAVGTGTTAVPGTLTFEGSVQFSDLPRIRENN